MGYLNRCRNALTVATLLFALVCVLAGVFAQTRARQQPPISISKAPTFTVDGKVALNAFVSLCDEHLRKIADSLEMVAKNAGARPPEWEQIRRPLSDVAKINVPAVYWFALPDGSYSTLQQGRVAENLASRPYFPRVMAGERVVGDLVLSHSTGKSVAIVAAPIFRPDKTVSGVLGASVYLDRLSALIQREMSVGESMIFFTFDAAPLLGLVWDPRLIFVDPTKLGEPVAKAFREMLSHDQGTVTYTFRNEKRTVLYRRSALTGWRYAFGVIHRNRAAR